MPANFTIVCLFNDYLYTYQQTYDQVMVTLTLNNAVYKDIYKLTDGQLTLDYLQLKFGDYQVFYNKDYIVFSYKDKLLYCNHQGLTADNEKVETLEQFVNYLSRHSIF
jgi:hypothetical protein